VLRTPLVSDYDAALYLRILRYEPIKTGYLVELSVDIHVVVDGEERIVMYHQHPLYEGTVEVIKRTGQIYDKTQVEAVVRSSLQDIVYEMISLI
jgi:hypothetical protein